MNLKEKIEGLVNKLNFYTICTDQFEFDGCGNNIKQEHLFNLLKKYEFDDNLKMNEESIDEKDLKSFYFIILNHIKEINKKPVFAIRLRNIF